MSRTYLSHIKLHDFRTFGKFDLDVAPGPGLTLLVGPNGLGKSSFFDGIEWCLTGGIRRFSDYVKRLKEKDYLTRRDADTENSHLVTIGFDTGEEFTRTAELKPDLGRLISSLKAEGWGEINDLGAYLNLTHFLGQAAQQRFTSRDKNDQWKALKGPSGVNRLEEVRLALRGNATTAAFNRRLEQLKIDVQTAEEMLLRWTRDFSLLAELQALAEASGIPSADMIERDVDALAKTCQAAGLAMDTYQLGGAPAQQLIEVRKSLDSQRSELSNKQRQVERLYSIAARYESLEPMLDSDGKAVGSAAFKISEAFTDVSTALLNRKNFERQVEAETGSVVASRNTLQLSRNLAEKIKSSSEFTFKAGQLVERKNELLVALGTVDLAHSTAVDSLVDARDRQVSKRLLQERHAVDKFVVEKANSLSAMVFNVQAARNNVVRADREAAAAEPSTEAQRASIVGLQSSLTAAETQLATARRRESELAGAIANVAKHIGEHDKECPICATKFPIGTLRTLAIAASRNKSEELTRLARRVERIRRTLDEAMATLSSLQESGARASIAQVQLVDAERSLVDARFEVATLLGVDVNDDLPLMASKRASATLAAIAEIDVEIAAKSSSIATLEESVAAAERERKMLLSQVEDIDQEYDANKKLLDEINLLLEDVEGSLDLNAVAARIHAEEQLLIEAEGRLSAAQANLTSSLAIEAAANQHLSAANAASHQLKKLIYDAEAERDSIALVWAAEGVDGKPSSRGVSEYNEAILLQISRFDGLLAEVDRLARALQGLATWTELQALEGRLIEEVEKRGEHKISQHQDFLRKQLGAAQKMLRTAEQAQSALNSYTVQLKVKADEFSTKFLKPLNGLILDFNKALLSTPGETVQFEADAALNRTEFGMQLLYADEVDNSRFNTELAPQLVLSEGQMAANGFSILCAASVAYKWSNWRALLLDDPLQHNDIVHAAAFADVMCNLVEFEKYQLIMSSHDRSEAEFLFRKFEAAGQACTMVTLTAPSSNGVLSGKPYYNTAAAGMFAQPFAAAG